MTVKSSVQVYNLSGEGIRRIRLPAVFNTPIRPDVITKVVAALQSHRIQPQGRNPMAGQRTSAESLGTGHGLARVPRVKGERYPRSGAAAVAPGTVKGRAGHPPSSQKAVRKKINKKERILALKSAIAATAHRELVSNRGHAIEDVLNFPLVVDDSMQEIARTKQLQEALAKLGVWPDVLRVSQNVKIRSGKTKGRRTRRRVPKGPLLVIAEDKGIGNASRNLPGVEVAKVSDLNAELLAPGSHPGRLTIWSESAVKGLR
jgi:large subunit ribosomal protein L4e